MGEAEPGQRDQCLHQLVPEVRQLAALRPGLGQPGSGRAVGLADELDQHLGADHLHRVGHRSADGVQLAHGGELGAGPLRGDHLPPGRGAAGHGPADPGIPVSPPFQVRAVAVEHLVLGGAVPLGRQQTGPAGFRHTAADQEDVGLLAGLQQPELGVHRAELGDQPGRVGTGPALAGGWLIPGGPAVALGKAVNGVEGIRGRQPAAVPIPLGEGWFVVLGEGGLVVAVRPEAPPGAAVERIVGHCGCSSGERWSGTAA